jgi:hypothetical protein
LARRAARAALFIAEPQNYKVCDQCLSIARLLAPVCPICGAWRWDATPERIIEVSRTMAENPFPITAGVVPRLKDEGG